MHINEVKRIMDKAHALNPNKISSCWAYEMACPHGVITTQEQYDYIKYYSDNSDISMEGMKCFEEDKGRYLNLGNHFGGASFYFCTMSVESAQESIKKYPNIFPETVDWSWGDYGKIEF